MGKSLHETLHKPRLLLKAFAHDSRSVGVLLLACTLFSLIVSNIGGIGQGYHGFWETEIPFLHRIGLPHTVLHFINDALMTLFFFLVGMEIKREVLVGELSSPSRVAIPIVAAICGVLAPALIFTLLNSDAAYKSGWAIPTATDIAFSLGILSLLKGVPHSMKVFLAALAIIDDLIAILIIALFYGDRPDAYWLLCVAGCILFIVLALRLVKNRNIRKLLFFGAGIFMWYAMLQSGIHATFAGVLLAMLMPIGAIPRYEKKLHIPVNFIVISIFALANTSIIVDSAAIANLSTTLSLGIILGLCIGKPLGISLSVIALTRSPLWGGGHRPQAGLLVGVGALAGIGFTMSIFISTLSFADKALQDTAKLAVLIASSLSMLAGYFWLRFSLSRQNKKDPARENPAGRTV